jgi:hypothetical protein
VTQIRPNWLFLSCVVASLGAPPLALLLPWPGRTVSAAIGFVAFVVLAFQFAQWYRETPTSTRIGVMLLLIGLLGGAIAQAQVGDSIPSTYATYPLIVQRMACLLFGVFFRRALDLGHDVPWLRSTVPARPAGDRTGGP